MGANMGVPVGVVISVAVEKEKIETRQSKLC